MRSRFQFVDDHRDTYEVKRLCQVLDVNRSSYYKWLADAEARAARQRKTGSWPRRSARSTASPAAPTAPRA
uniref:Transposase n=1 Tax=Streptomyces sp. NBC_01393 TaxID=2903851 RepID=A0AAU3HPH0_9ACTN